MNNVKQLKEQYSGEHPGFGSYLECMSRTLLKGLSSFTIAFAAIYLPQTLLKKKLPSTAGVQILSSTLIASAVSYYITSQQTKVCQAAWMAVEEKHTFLSPINPNLDGENS